MLKLSCEGLRLLVKFTVLKLDQSVCRKKIGPDTTVETSVLSTWFLRPSQKWTIPGLFLFQTLVWGIYQIFITSIVYTLLFKACNATVIVQHSHGFQFPMDGKSISYENWVSSPKRQPQTNKKLKLKPKLTPKRISNKDIVESCILSQNKECATNSVVFVF